jgi:hypothetical protein
MPSRQQLANMLILMCLLKDMGREEEVEICNNAKLHAEGFLV